MHQDTQKSKQVVLARAGLVLSFSVFMLCAAVAFFSDAPALVVVILSVCSGLMLWAAIFAGKKGVLFLGRFFPP
jgi:uncharacterized integral membrane protein